MDHLAFTTALILGVGFVYFSSVGIASAVTANSTINLSVSSTVTISSSGTVNLTTTPGASAVQTIAGDTVTVSTNDTNGYTLQLADASASNNSLISGSNTVAASSGTQTTPLAQTANAWGYRVDGVGGFGAGPTSAATNTAVGSIKFAGVPLSASPNTIKTTATTASGDTTSVWYGAAINSSQPSGTYSSTVTYTATGN